LKFMESKGHTIIPSASLIPPETDPTALFTTAGMHPLVPYLMGEKHPGGNKVANSQKCVRTIDIDEVGDESHLTFFEMLGNWSFGSPDAPDGVGAGYFKKEAIEWSFEFLTNKEWLGISSERLSVTVFEGDPSINSGQVPRDDESAKIWQSLGIPKERIFYKGREDNWWGPAGATGPCGPDTEIFINGTEIWNDVFMEYNKTIDGRFETLKQKNVDTGMGLERIAMVMQNVSTVYETDLFEPIIAKIKKLAVVSSQSSVVSTRIIADHIKASVFIITDGVEPSNVGRGYVLRRLIRRAVRHGKILGIENNFISEIAKAVVEIYKDIYTEVVRNKDMIFEILNKEENNFRKSLERGLKDLKIFNRVDAKKAFYIYETFGFPLEMIQEELAKRALFADEDEFKEEMKKHQELSRTASAGMFKGGLADASEQTTKYHTATHLLHQALRDVLGNHVIQKGSNITAERLRFDFSHSQKVTPEQIKQVEDIVNEKIQENLPVICEEMSLEEAQKSGALGAFEQKYGDKVKVYSVRAFSAEICGGPHAERTGELGKFKILKEEASAAGIRRIKAVLE